ncbi:MAG: hypothetical protein QCI82_08885 [Candidatus Thermoplasmatota archaeon]|nr:hypothetical protein [Candidatus Thermoplasmatota archaeon]
MKELRPDATDGPTPWRVVRFADIQTEVMEVIRIGCGVAEVAEDPASDLKFILIHPVNASTLFPELRADDKLYIRTLPKAGRELCSIFIKCGSAEYIGSIEMLESPPSSWILGRKVRPFGEGEAFCSPPMTLPLEMQRKLLLSSLSDVKQRPDGLHSYRWLCEASVGAATVEYIGSGQNPYSEALSFMVGRDLNTTASEFFDIQEVPMFDMPLTESLRSFFAGTSGVGDHPGHLLGARSVELALSMLLQASDADNHPSLVRLKSICGSLVDDVSLFNLIDRREMDPFYLQKLFKLNKARQRTDMAPTSSAFLDSRTVNLIASSRRRGLTREEICLMTGMDFDALAKTEETFGIVPGIEPAIEGCHDGMPPLVLSWPEPSHVFGEGQKDGDTGSEDRIQVTDVIPGWSDVCDGGRPLFAVLGEDVFDKLKVRYPGLVRKNTAK